MFDCLGGKNWAYFNFMDGHSESILGLGSKSEGLFFDERFKY